MPFLIEEDAETEEYLLLNVNGFTKADLSVETNKSIPCFMGFFRASLRIRKFGLDRNRSHCAIALC
ncbi:hypothetical protein BV378_16260 [Nostoc sp. RF31YmG]|nr:hypothetical protein BV378_16260 [Nostoc sp. RF31YmG]